MAITVIIRKACKSGFGLTAFYLIRVDGVSRQSEELTKNDTCLPMLQSVHEIFTPSPPLALGFVSADIRDVPDVDNLSGDFQACRPDRNHHMRFMHSVF